MDFGKVEINNLQIINNLTGVAADSDRHPPFKFYTILDLLKDTSAITLRDELASHVKVHPKDNDLYKFRQSKDLKSELPEKKLPLSIRSFIKVMLNDVRPLLEKESNLTLSDAKFDITASRYDQGNYLLCHNDDMKDPSQQQARAVAFIYYLTTRPWTKDDGGALIVYDHDQSGEPVKVNNLVYPRPNTLVLFETGSTSWHSVQEVLCENDCRLSINGWFHFASTQNESQRTTQTRQLEPNPFLFLQPIPLDDRMERFFEECVNPQYMLEKTCYLIRRKFKRNSEINLPHFLKDEKFLEISEAIKKTVASEDNLQLVGPYNKRSYKRIKLDCLPPVCRDLCDAFRSELFFMLLSRFTGLDLQPPHLVHEKQIQDSSDDEADRGGSSSEEEDSESHDDQDSVAEGTSDDQDIHGEDKTDNERELDAKSGVDAEVDTETQASALQAQLIEVGDKERGGDTTETSRGCVTDAQKTSKRKLHCDPISRQEFRHLDSGAYTLIHDYAYELGEKSALDVILHFNHDFEVRFEHGGYLSYIDVSEDADVGECELLKVVPKSNCLSLVYRSDQNTCRFMKYISSRHESSFQDLYCVYYERADDLPIGTLAKKFKATDETRQI